MRIVFPSRCATSQSTSPIPDTITYPINVRISFPFRTKSFSLGSSGFTHGLYYLIMKYIFCYVSQRLAVKRFGQRYTLLYALNAMPCFRQLTLVVAVMSAQLKFRAKRKRPDALINLPTKYNVSKSKLVRKRQQALAN